MRNDESRAWSPKPTVLPSNSAVCSGRSKARPRSPRYMSHDRTQETGIRPEQQAIRNSEQPRNFVGSLANVGVGYG